MEPWLETGEPHGQNHQSHPNGSSRSTSSWHLTSGFLGDGRWGGAGPLGETKVRDLEIYCNPNDPCFDWNLDRTKIGGKTKDKWGQKVYDIDTYFITTVVINTQHIQRYIYIYIYIHIFYIIHIQVAVFLNQKNTLQSHFLALKFSHQYLFVMLKFLGGLSPVVNFGSVNLYPIGSMGRTVYLPT